MPPVASEALGASTSPGAATSMAQEASPVWVVTRSMCRCERTMNEDSRLGQSHLESARYIPSTRPRAEDCACDARRVGEASSRDVDVSQAVKLILIIVLVLLLLGALPMWPYSSSWGYFPSGGLGLLLIILVVVLLLGSRNKV
jgi:hypothetical protein